MKQMLNKLIFKDLGFLPYEYYVVWPVNPDDQYLRVFMQPDKGDEWQVRILRISLSIA